MSDLNYSNLGNEISEMVQNAIEKQDFSQLSETIQHTVGTVTEAIVSGTKSEYQKDRRPDYMKQAQRKMAAAQPPQNPWKGKEADAQGMQETGSLYSPGGAGRFKGYLLFTLGIAGIFGSMAGVLTLCIASSISGVALTTPKTILLILAAAFAGMTWKGSRTLKKIKKFKNYVKKIGKNTSITIADLAAASGRSEKEVRKDIQDMLQEMMFLQGHLDEKGARLFVTDAAYQAWQKEQQKLLEVQRKEQEAQEQELREQKELPPEVQKLVAEGRTYIQKIRESNDAIQDEIVSQKLDDLETMTRKIFAYVKEHPECADDTKKLMKYYLPTTIRLLDAYRKLTEEAESGQHPGALPNIAKSKKEIEETLDTLNNAFAKLFDNLYQDTSMDIRADISVLHTLLAQEGLTGDKL